jgi:membrane protein
LSVLFVIATAIVLLALSVLIVVAPIIISFVERHAPQSGGRCGRLQPCPLPGRGPAADRSPDRGPYFLLPAKHLRLRQVLPGVVLTVATWVVLATVYSYYLANFGNFASFYAGLSGVFAALFFLYLAALVLLLGGEVNRVFMLRKQGRAS